MLHGFKSRLRTRKLPAHRAGGGLLLRSRRLSFRQLQTFWRRQRLSTRIIALSSVLLLLSTLIIDILRPGLQTDRYSLARYQGNLLKSPVSLYAKKLRYDQPSQTLIFNEGYKPTASEVAGQSSGPKVSARFGGGKDRSVAVTDPFHEVDMSFTPKFGVLEPKKNLNRVVYPLQAYDGLKVYTLKGNGIKEDIILNSFNGNELSLAYELSLPEGTEARLENNGSLAVYGVRGELLGNVTTGSESDADLLKKVRQNSEKSNLLFRIPAPVVLEGRAKLSASARARFELNNNTLTVHTTGLKNARYPLSIDPSIYVETAAKLMRGNNETNTDFDIDNELIQKSQTTGARIDAWQGTLDMSQGSFDHATAAAGGYIYRAGGRTSTTKPLIVDQKETIEGTDTGSFVMDMPDTRPAGDLYVAMLCYDGSQGDGSGGSTAGNTLGTPSGWTKYANRNGHAAYYKVGTDAGGGNEAATYTFTGDSEKWAGVIIRITGFNSGDPIAGTAGVGHSNSSAVPVFPATTPDANATLILRSVGADEDVISDTGWVPYGHTKIASANSTGTGDCSYAAASLDTPPASGVSTGTTTLNDSSLNDDYGASSIAINPSSTSAAMLTRVEWAKFNSSTQAIESPNPGTGACSSWCNNSAYNLSEARRGHAMVSYNGYLYVMGGSDGTNLESTVLIAKLGANGEPQLWHPTDTNKNNWVYWYQDTGLNGGTARAYHAAYAYKNKMYILGGDTNTTANSGGATTVEIADILPNGRLGSWSSGTALPNARYGLNVQVYNDYMYLIGGNNNGTMVNTVYYNKLNSDGTMNSWVQTTSFANVGATAGRSSHGGLFTTIWGAYIYLTGGCAAVNASGHCTTIADDTQLGSINADGSISEWGSITNLANQRMGFTIVGWQNGLYRLGGCAQQNTTSGECEVTLADVDYGVINPAGEVSTVDISSPSGSGFCTGGSPHSCDLPAAGDDGGEIGHMLSMSVILNGFLYVIGGCAEYDCNTGTDSPTTDNISSNTAFVAIAPDGRLSAPPSCGGTSSGAWCVDNTNTINGADGVAAAGVTIFNNRIYVIGGIDSTANETGELYYNSVNATTGALSGGWTAQTLTSIGMSAAYDSIFYTYAYARANPSQAGTYPGNLYVFGGCATGGSGAGCSSDDYRTEVYKCWIETTGAIETTAGSGTFDCTTTGQLQIDSDPSTGGSQGLGIHSGTVYANYIYLVGGFSQTESDKDTVLYAQFDDSNNVVAVTGFIEECNVTASGTAWVESCNTLSVGRRRGFSFGYNGHIYSVGGYDADGGGQIIPFIEWAKMIVSDGSIEGFQTSNVTINQRWGLSMAVSNAYAYVIGGCDVGASPGDCSSFEPAIQTFQLYNNDSGAINNFAAQTDQTFSASTDRWGASAAVLNGYLYVAGGCTSATDCTTAVSDVQKAPITVSDGTIGTWTNTSIAALPAVRAWGELVTAGGYLYYLGGQDSTATNEQSTVYYTQPDSSGNIASWSTASGGIGDTASQAAQPRTKFGAAVWNNRIYVVGGLNSSAAVTDTVYISPQLNSGGNIAADSWTSDADTIDVARTGMAVTAYANNLYLFGGFDGTNYLSDAQFAQINSDGTIDAWSFTTSLPGPLRDSRAFVSNGYVYLVGGRSAASTCAPKTLITPVSANTTIGTGNDPTGVGEWYETNVKYSGDRYGAAVAYDNGKIHTMGGGCTAPLSSNRHYSSTVRSQPQVATYSRMIDTDTDVFPNTWLLNGVDNSIGARWQMRYRSMHDLDTAVNPNEDCGTSLTMPQMTTWGQDTNFGDVTLSKVEQYTPKNSSGGNINCARYFYFLVTIDASKTFGYPEDVDRGPTITDLSLFFTSDPSKRLRHGKTYTGGELQPLDTPCRFPSNPLTDPNRNNCPLPE